MSLWFHHLKAKTLNEYSMHPILKYTPQQPFTKVSKHKRSPITTAKISNIQRIQQRQPYISSFVNRNLILLRLLFLIIFVIQNTVVLTTTSLFPVSSAVPVLFVPSLIVRPIVRTGCRYRQYLLLLDHRKSSLHKDCCPIVSKMSSSFALRCSSTGSTSSSTTTNTNTESYIQVLSKAVSDAIGTIVELEMTSGGGGSGGSGATTFVVRDKLCRHHQYFVKSTSHSTRNQQMMYGEYCSVNAIYQTNTIRVPKPIAFGNYIPGGRTFVIFEYLHFAPSSSTSHQYALGRQLAKLHLESIPNHTEEKPVQYGFHVNNTIGATFQPNLPYYTSWTDFYINHRLNHMLQLTNNVGMSNDDVEALRNKVRHTLDEHASTVQPCLVHGDLWGGNKGFCYDDNDDQKDVNDNNNNNNAVLANTPKKRIVVPCIFDPASYYGDREVDIAMTYVFGGFSTDFYQGYNHVYPLASGHESRRIIYNLYHILNHDVLFGIGYRNQARNMIYEILRM